MGDVVKLTKNMLGLLGRIKDGQLLIAYLPPGSQGPHKWYVETPYSDEDGRTAWALLERGLLQHEGEGLYIIAPAGLSALTSKEQNNG